ncbi:MAG: glycosyltransferase [Coriobacteriia bacterium]|nr:glycosyltransferase [Coriobacteriia bacterium]
MRILMVTDTYAPARNGVAMWVALSVRELRARGHEVDVLTYAHERRPKDLPGLIELPAYFGLDSDFKVAPIMSGLPVAAEQGSWDVVHVHHPILLGPEGVRLGRKVGAKVVFTCHSVYTDYLDEYYWGIGKPLKPALSRRTAAFVNGCDIALAPSSRVVRWLRENGVSTRIEMLEAPADTDRIVRTPRADARRTLGLGDEAVALYVGRIADEKRIDVLVDEFAKCCKGMPGAILALAGRGVRYRSVERQVRRLGLPDRVRMLGALGGDELGLWYSAADIGVSASRSETGPLTVVEAMACGCPTVALDAPGFEDRITHGVNGLLAADEPGALAEAMGRVMGDASLRERLAAGALASASRYTPATNAELMLSMYGETQG